jgi:hypothetical protein
MTVTYAYDITSANYQKRPPTGQICLYGTGTPDIQATPAMRQANPRAIIIGQSPTVLEDATVDIIDYERGAVQLSQLPGVVRDCLDSYDHADRPGQRTPLVYASLSNIPAVAIALTTAGLKGSGVGLYVADWSYTQAQAIAQLGHEINGYPVRGWQYQSLTDYDLDVFDTEWVNTVSGTVKPVKAQVPPGQWNDAEDWTWKSVVVIGVGEDGKLYSFAYDPGTGTWSKSLT